MCRNLGVSRSGYHAWKARPQSESAQRNNALLHEVEKIIQFSNSALGYRQITKQLLDLGISVSKNRVQRLLQRQGYRAIMCRKVLRHKKGLKQSAPVQNLLNRAFQPEKVNQVWASDITQIRCREGWLYVCVVMDLHSRAIIGMAQSKRNDAGLVVNALLQAQKTSGLSRLDKTLFHSDQGSQYCSLEVRQWLVRRGATISQSRKGNCWDNACVESFFSLMKQQWLYPVGITIMKKMKRLVSSYIGKFYNCWRIHGSIGQTPMACYSLAVTK